MSSTSSIRKPGGVDHYSKDFSISKRLKIDPEHVDKSDLKRDLNCDVSDRVKYNPESMKDYQKTGFKLGYIREALYND